MTAHLEFFALSVEPVSKGVAGKDLWLPPSKKSRVEELIDAIEARESGLGRAARISATGGVRQGKIYTLFAPPRRSNLFAAPRNFLRCGPAVVHVGERWVGHNLSIRAPLMTRLVSCSWVAR